MLNYFKSTTGTMSNATMQTHVTTFDDADPSDTRRAHREAREAFGGVGVVSVWQRAATVATYVAVIGERTGDGADDRRYRGRQVAESDAAGAGLGCGGAE